MGYLVYENEAVIGWVGLGPKVCFPRLETKLASRLSPFAADTWSIGCLALKAEFRGQGYADRIVPECLSVSKALGATAIEAYPVRPWDEHRSYRGALSSFKRSGFKEVYAEQDEQSEILLMILQF